MHFICLELFMLYMLMFGFYVIYWRQVHFICLELYVCFICLCWVFTLSTGDKCILYAKNCIYALYAYVGFLRHLLETSAFYMLRTVYMLYMLYMLYLSNKISYKIHIELWRLFCQN